MTSTAMTRGQFALELATRLGLDMTGHGGFNDAGPYDAALTALKKAGIVTGTGDGNFSPFETVKREDVAVMVGRAYDISKAGGSSFGDIPANHYAAAAIGGLQDLQIFNGVGGGLFGAGRGFTFNQWDLVQSRLTDYQSNMSLPTTPPSSGAVSDPAPTQADVDAYAWAEDYLANEFDLPGMGAWVQEMVTKYGTNLDTATIDAELRKTPEFDDRFGDVMRARKAAGMNPVSPAHILANENAYESIMRASGLPPGFYDQRSDFTELLISDVSPAQLQTRIARGFERVAQAPLEVRQAYADFYGVQGDEALAAYILDPKKAVPLLERQVQTAEVAGTGRQFGLSIGQQRAADLAGKGISEKLAFTGFARLSALSGLFSETIGDTTDLTAENQGVDAQLLGQGEAQQQLDRRVAERKAGSSGGGGSLVTQQGIIGTGEAL